MTYASVAAHDAPPPSEQPQPDQGLLEGHLETEDAHNPAVPDGTGIQVVPADFKETMETESKHVAEELDTKAAELKATAEREAAEVRAKAAAAKEKAEVEAEKAKKVVKDKAAKAEKEAVGLYNQAIAVLSKPRVLVPVLGALHLALLSFVGLKAQEQRRSFVPVDRKLVSAVVVGLGALLSVEGVWLNGYLGRYEMDGKRKRL